MLLIIALFTLAVLARVFPVFWILGRRGLRLRRSTRKFLRAPGGRHLFNFINGYIYSR